MLRLQCRDTGPATNSEASEADKASKSKAGASEAATAPQESTTAAPRALQRGCPGGPVVKNLPVNAGGTGSIPGLERSHLLWSS